MKEAIHYVDRIAAIFSITAGNAWPEDAKKFGALLDEALKDQRTDYEASLREIGELHASQIDSWEGEVKEIEAQRDALVLKRDELDTKLTMMADDLAGVRKMSRDWQEKAQQWKATAEEREKQNNSLLDDLHNMSTELAEMRGYIRRVEMYDPLSERELQDRAERPMVPLGENRKGRSDTDLYGMASADPRGFTPWYRRRPL